MGAACSGAGGGGRDLNPTNAADAARAKAAWRQWCATVEAVGLAAIDATVTDDEIDLAEGLRHLTRMVRMTLQTGMENTDPGHPYLDRRLGPTLKMGGDNACGLYLAAPINGADTFRLSGTRGSAAWISFMAQRSHDCFAAGLGVFGAALFTDIEVAADGTFEIILSPERRAGNWIETDRFSATLMIRQFFSDWDDVRPMDIVIENLTRGGAPQPVLGLDAAVAGLERAGRSIAVLTPAMQSEMVKKGETPNLFAVDIGDPTEAFGGVPGGNAVTLRWRLEPDEALLVEVRPPIPCAYWDIQLGNVWYESFDYRQVFSGICDRQAALNPDGSATIVLSDRDPGVCNWVEAAGHREGHLAVRWQLTDGQLPLPATRVVKAADVARLTGLPPVKPAQRQADRRAMRAAVERRFRP
jgi:hypothetical protein